MKERPIAERSGPLQNRVTPFGEIISTAERGLLMGNRGGAIHNAAKQLTSRRWVSNHWIICLLEFKGRKMELMAPGQYTQLFFLDEATALSAGHRPCFECQRTKAKQFFDAWRKGNPLLVGEGALRVDLVDVVLQRERLTRDRSKMMYETTIGELPGGVLVVRSRSPKAAWLLWQGRLRLWTPGGYTDDEPARSMERVRVLTPRSVVNAFVGGYVPAVHPTGD